jgi:hypothetical protein
MTLKRMHRVLKRVTPKATWCDTDERAAVFGKIAA